MAHAVKTEHCYVHKDRAICGGDPVIVGTRIPVRLVYQRAQAGEPMETIRQTFPHLTPAQIHDALIPLTFLLDENIHAALAPQLRQRGIDAQSVYDLQQHGWTDAALLKDAVA